MKNMLNIVIVGLVIVGVVFSLVATLKSSGWSTTEGTMLESEVRTIGHTVSNNLLSDDKRLDYEIVVKFEYVVNGKRLVGDKLYAKMPNIISNSTMAEDVVKKFPKGSNVKVYFNPKDPQDSCLEVLEGVSVGKKIGFVFLILIVISIFVVGFYYTNKLLD